MGLATHAALIAQYVQHECAHGLVHGDPRVNALLGWILSWMTGAAYFPFDGYREMHLRHHRYICDFVGFSTRAFARRRTIWSRIAIAAEAIHLPALHFHIRLYTTLSLFRQGGPYTKLRILVTAASRIAFYGTLLAKSFSAAATVFVAYLLFVHCNRAVDAFQHTYQERDGIPDDGIGSWEDEQKTTFSVPLLGRAGCPLGFAVLHFNLHNAHHFLPSVPWYNLPKLHAWLYADPSGAQMVFARVSITQVLCYYHRHRIRRIMGGQGQARGPDGELDFSRFYGAFTDRLGLPLEGRQ